MAEYDLYLKPKKCVFEQRTITYLGLVIGEGEICMDPLKVEAVRTWPPPRNLHELRIFLGLIGWLQPFLEGFSHKSHPLNHLTKCYDCASRTTIFPFLYPFLFPLLLLLYYGHPPFTPCNSLELDLPSDTKARTRCLADCAPPSPIYSMPYPRSYCTPYACISTC